MANQSVRLFISCASGEFEIYRDALRHALTRPNVEVKIQEDFKSLGSDTLGMLEEYIEHCEAVVHFVGDTTGELPAANTVEGLLARRPDFEAELAKRGIERDALGSLSYTQWEAWLAICFGKDLLIVQPAAGIDRGPRFTPTSASRALQAEHLNRLKAIDRYPGPPFTSADNLVAQILVSAVIDALVKAAALSARQPRNLPFVSLGDLFKGRDKALDDLRAALMDAKGVAVAGRALHGLGGIGKTRLAIEYALRHEADYSALLFVRADDPATLNASLASLVAAEVLDLPEKEAREDVAKIEAVVRWLAAHRTWLMILDNVDDENAVAAVTGVMPRLMGGHVIITARAANFPASLRTLELSILDDNAATDFLMERTRGDRAQAPNDAAQARALAHELGGLALGLEQAGAYIARQHIGFARYIELWSEKRASVLNWFDKTLMGYDHDVGLAATWATSVERLIPDSLRLLDRLAFLAPDPIPGSLIDVPIRGEAADADAHEALVGLYAYSLVMRASGEDGAEKGFVVHRLVQDFARRAMTAERRGAALREALGWVNAAFAGDPDDVRNWSILDPLTPHTLAIAGRAEEAGITDPTGRLLNNLAILAYAKGRYKEAEPLFRRALVILEKNLGDEHPQVATAANNLATLLNEMGRPEDAESLYRRALAIGELHHGPNHPALASTLNNLALLLEGTGRLNEAVPLCRRALAIWEGSRGPSHPDVATGSNNLAGLLKTGKRYREAEQLFRRAQVIDEANYGPDHPKVARDLSNLAMLLQDTNRIHEAESHFRRALAIDEASYGPDHPDVARDLNNLALLLQSMDHIGEAELLHRRALAIDERSYGAIHPAVATNLSNLATLFRDTNRHNEAEPLYRRALTIYEWSRGVNHPSTVAVRLALAALSVGNH